MFECCLNGDWWKSDYVPASLKKTKDVSGYYGVFIMPPTADSSGQWRYVFGLSIRLMNMISQEFHGGISSKGHNFPPDSRMNWFVFSSQRSLWPYKSCFWSRLHTLIMANDTQMSKKNNMMKWQHIVFRCHCNIIMSCHYPAATECKLVTKFHIWSDNEFVIPVSVYTAHFHKTVNSHFCLLSAPPSTEYTDLMLACC